MNKVYAEIILLRKENDWIFENIPNAFFEMLGYEEKEFKTICFSDFSSFFLTHEREALLNGLHKLDVSGKPLEMLCKLHHNKNGILNVQILAEAVAGSIEKKIQVSVMDVTPVVKTLDALKLQLSSLECACPGGLCKAVMDDSITVIWHNQVFLDIIGYTEEQFKNELHGCAQGYIHPEDEWIVAEEFAKIRDEISQCTAKEVRIIRRDKQVRTLVIVFSRANENYNGYPVFYSSGIDITESKRARQLAIEAQRFQTAMRQSSSCICEYDVSRRCILASYGLWDLLGIRGDLKNVPESLIESQIVCHPSHEDFRLLFDETSFKSDKTEKMIQFCRSDGTKIWVRVSITYVFDDKGMAVKGIAIMEDVTKQYNQNQGFQKEEKWRTSKAFDLIFACQMNLTRDSILAVNEKAFVYDDISKCASKLIEKNVRDHVHPDDKVRYLHAFGCDNLVHNFKHGICEHILEYRVINRDGKIRWRQTVAHVVLEPGKGDVIANIYVKDINEQKMSEIELRKRAEQDELTGLYNRYAMETNCRKGIDMAKGKQLCALLEMDLEGLNDINNNYGHYKGDSFLRLTAKIIKSVFPKEKALAGYMGRDSFLIFFPNCISREEVMQKADSVCGQISSELGKDWNAVASIGIAFAPDDGMDYERLLQCADAALSHAKRMGKNQCVAYRGTMKLQTNTEMLTVSREWLLDEANDIIYIADLHTYELLYMNSNMKKLFGQGDDSYKGLKCYKVIQNLDKPCEFCTNSLLSSQEFYHWNYYNPIIGQSLILKDRIVDWYGQPARIEFATNVSELDALRMKAEEQNKTILSSIDYASKIQQNLLPRNRLFQKTFSDFSIIWCPRDIVGGDIYWMESFEAGALLCVCDCTGHGTPGALLTMLMVSTLKEIVNEENCSDTAQILYMLDNRVASVLNVDKQIENTNGRETMDFNDGCDIAAIFIANDGSVSISSSSIQIFICDGNTVRRMKGQKLHIGDGRIQKKDDIDVVLIPANHENKFYVASDGLFHQMGGEPICPFGYDTIQRIILDHHHEPLQTIANNIWAAFKMHMGEQARRDDVELISFQV